MTHWENGRGPLILRVNREGRVAAMNDSARQILGDSGLGRACDEVIRGKTEAGTPLCRPGCAQELVAGTLEESGAQRMVFRASSRCSTRLECFRVGSEVHVRIERPPPVDSTERLTSRERRVLSLVGRGYSSAQIAKELQISVATVRTHVEHARGRLGASTRAQAVLRAFQTWQLDEEPTDKG